jgi:hypothetical protein
MGDEKFEWSLNVIPQIPKKKPKNFGQLHGGFL